MSLNAIHHHTSLHQKTKINNQDKLSDRISEIVQQALQATHVAQDPDPFKGLNSKSSTCPSEVQASVMKLIETIADDVRCVHPRDIAHLFSIFASRDLTHTPQYPKAIVQLTQHAMRRTKKLDYQAMISILNDLPVWNIGIGKHTSLYQQVKVAFITHIVEKSMARRSEYEDISIAWDTLAKWDIDCKQLDDLVATHILFRNDHRPRFERKIRDATGLTCTSSISIAPIFRAQDIANIFHVLSKSNIDFNESPYKQAFIILLQEIQDPDLKLNPQAIATILHAFAKWSMPSDYKQLQSTSIEVHTSPYKEAILKLVNTMSELNISFNPQKIPSQAISDIVYALDRWQYALKKHDSTFDPKLFWKVSASLGSHVAKLHRF